CARVRIAVPGTDYFFDNW
nr:immunoglobulin heavy chain junction region [Macaca mulatta]MOW76097.1 immunoglobulin heavy chain junction region [Macaca mulatta]MOW81087.1 immunoglobulin heavy chain junction region [Macaca mulatta]MOW84534.1 immunoglobulin heavy chain junction region [Macaca mulatta]